MIVITGAYGFIGSNLVTELECKSNEELVLVDYFGTNMKWKNMVARRLHTMLEPHQLLNFIDNNYKRISCIIHLGAISSTTEEDVDKLIHNNFLYTINLLDACNAYRIRMIYASSASVYGNGELGFNDSDAVEDISSLRPLNAYGWSKKLIDEACAKRNFVNIVGLRFFNVYGPNEYHKEEQASVVYKWYNGMKHDATISLFRSYVPEYEDGGQLRDFVYIQDCIDAILWFLGKPDIAGVYNVGTGCARSFMDIITILERIMQKKARYEFVDMPEQIKLHYQYNTKANLSKLRKAGFTKEMMTLDRGIEQYVTLYLNTNNPYR